MSSSVHAGHNASGRLFNDEIGNWLTIQVFDRFGKVECDYLVFPTHAEFCPNRPWMRHPE
jgi:hypothetical protein